MALIANNIIAGETVKKGASIAPQQPKRLTIFEKLRQQKVEVETPKIIEEPVEKYKHVKEGELHKLINTKSSYLSDMIALKD